MLTHNTPEISKALAKQLDPAQFVRTCITHYQRGDDRMLKADPRTFVMACVEAAQLGLKPDSALGECYLLPVWDSRSNGYVVDFRIGYQGMMKLARRSGDVLAISAEVAYENDLFEVVLGTEREIRHVPWYCNGASEPGEVIAAYATAKLEGGTVQFAVLTRSQLDRRAEKSGDPRNANPSNVWRDWYDPMARKSAVRELCKWLSMDDRSRAAMRRDDLLEVERDAADPPPGRVTQIMDMPPESYGTPTSLDDLAAQHRRGRGPEDEDQRPPQEPEDESQAEPDDDPPPEVPEDDEADGG